MFRAPGFMINKLIIAALPISQGDQETPTPTPRSDPEEKHSSFLLHRTLQTSRATCPHSHGLGMDTFPCSGCFGITVRQEFEAFLPSLGLALLFWTSYLIPSFTVYKEGLIILNLVSHCKDKTRPSGKPHISKVLWIPLLFFMCRWKKRFESEDSVLRCFILAGLHSRAVLAINFLVTSYRDVLFYSFCGSAPSVDQQNPWVFLRGYNQSQWGLKSYLKAHPRKHSSPNSCDCWQDSIIRKLL